MDINKALECINYDILLTYLSYFSDGRREKIKDYINNIDYNDNFEKYVNEDKDNRSKSQLYNRIFQMFSRLGHIEFDYINNKYSVCPPTLVVLPNKEQCILCGSRTKIFKNKILPYLIEEDNYLAPKCWKINTENIEDIKQKVELRISENFTQNMLSIVPTVENIIKTEETESPIRLNINPIKKYNPTNYRYETINNFDNLETGLYERKNIYNYTYFYLDETKNWHSIDKYYGQYLMQKNNNKILTYDESTSSLFVNASMPLPELIDRALTMLSGKNPELVGYEYKYDNINLDINNKIEKILGQLIGGKDNVSRER